MRLSWKNLGEEERKLQPGMMTSTLLVLTYHRSFCFCFLEMHFCCNAFNTVAIVCISAGFTGRARCTIQKSACLPSLAKHVSVWLQAESVVDFAA